MTNHSKDILAAHAAGYRVSKTGEVIGPSGEVRVPNGNRKYYSFTFKRPGTRETGHVAVHRLQAFQKFGDAALVEGIHVRHLDSNSRNNADDNIAIGTPQQNMLDKPESVRRAASLKASAAHKKHDHSAIKEFFAKCRSYAQTMREFGITSKGTLHFIINGKTSHSLPHHLNDAQPTARCLVGIHPNPPVGASLP